MSSDSKYYKEIESRLKKAGNKENLLNAAFGIQYALYLSAGIFLVFSFAELVGYLSVLVKTILFFLFLIASIGSFGYYFFIPLLKHYNLFGHVDVFKTARIAGGFFPIIKDDLLNALQLVSGKADTNMYSVSLIDAAFKNVYNKTKDLNFDSIVTFNKAKKMFLRITLPGMVVLSFLFMLTPLNSAAGRLIDFNKRYLPPQKFYFEVEPGNAKVTKGNDIIIKVKIKGIMPDEVYLAVKDFDQPEFRKTKIEQDSTGSFVFHTSSVQNSFKYFAAAEDISSDEYTIEVVDFPAIKSFEVNVVSPSYSGIPAVKQPDNGNVTALLGSSVQINISSTKDLKNAYVLFADTTKSNLSVSGKNVTGSFKVTGDNSYKVIITDIDNNQNLSPISYNIKALYDSPPAIELIQPVKNVDLANDNRLPVLVKISDDYGFSKLQIKYKVIYQGKESSPVNGAVDILFNHSQKDAEVNYIWNLTSLHIGPADAVEAYVEVLDNDFVSGPKSAKTSSFSIRIPSLEELLSKADNTQMNAQQNLKEVMKESEELKKNIEKTEQELKQDKKDITWQEKEKVQNTIDKFKQLQNKTEKASQDLQKMQEDLQKNNLLSKETLEKYMELQDLLHNLSSEEMKKVMDRLQNALQKMDRQMTQDALKNMKLDEEVFKKSIERTLNLLKRVQVEQKLDEMSKRTEEITKRQNQIQNEAKNKDLANKNNADNLSKEQKDLTEDIKKLQQEMKELQEKMKQLDDMPKENMEKMNEELEKQNNDELSKEAEKQLMQNQKQQAMQNQMKIAQNMQKMKQSIQQMQSQMAQQNQVQSFKNMMKILDNLVSLSKDQEKLKSESRQLDFNSSEFNKEAEKQSKIGDNLDKILKQMNDLAQKSFAVTPDMGKALGDAKRSMDMAQQDLQGRNGMQAFNDQGNAMSSLNKAATSMKNSMESMMKPGGQGSSGMMSLMQQLGQMTQQQMQLNNMTQQLSQKGGQLTPQQQGELQRLAQQQELIKKSMDQLNKEAQQQGQSKKLPGTESLPKQMEEIVSDMNAQKLDNNLIQKQERILSRMLDAQKSINERDYEKNRESFTGQNFQRTSPGQLNLKSQDQQNKLRDELNRASQEGYNKDYENLIRRYFEMLQKK